MDNNSTIQQSTCEIFSTEINVPAFNTNSEYIYIDTNDYNSNIANPVKYKNITTITNGLGTKYYGIKTNNYSYIYLDSETNEYTESIVCNSDINAKVVALNPITTVSQLYWFNNGENYVKINSEYSQPGKELFFTYLYSYEYTQEGLTPEITGNTYNVLFYGAIPHMTLNRKHTQFTSINNLFELLYSDDKDNDTVNNVKTIYNSYLFTVPYTYTYDPDGTVFTKINNSDTLSVLIKNVYPAHNSNDITESVTWGSIYDLLLTYGTNKFINDCSIIYYSKENSGYTLADKQLIVNTIESLLDMLIKYGVITNDEKYTKDVRLLTSKNNNAQNIIDMFSTGKTEIYFNNITSISVDWKTCTKGNIEQIISYNLPIYSNVTYTSISNLDKPLTINDLLTEANNLSLDTDIITINDSQFGIKVVTNADMSFTYIDENSMKPNDSLYYYYNANGEPIASNAIKVLSGNIYLSNHYLLNYNKDNSFVTDSDLVFENYYVQIDETTLNKINTDCVDIYEKRITYTCVGNGSSNLNLLTFKNVVNNFENGLALYSNYSISKYPNADLSYNIIRTNINSENNIYYKYDNDTNTFSQWTYDEVSKLSELPSNIYIRYNEYAKLNAPTSIDGSETNIAKYVKLYNYFKCTDLSKEVALYIQRQDTETRTQYDYVEVPVGIDYINNIYYGKTYVELNPEELPRYSENNNNVYTGDIYVKSTKYVVVNSKEYFDYCIANNIQLYTVERSKLYENKINGQMLNLNGDTIYYINDTNAANPDKVTILTMDELKSKYFGKDDKYVDGFINYTNIGFKVKDTVNISWKESTYYIKDNTNGYVKINNWHAITNEGYNIKFYKYALSKLTHQEIQHKLTFKEQIYLYNRNINVKNPDVLYPVNENGFITKSFDSNNALIIDGYLIADNENGIDYYTRKPFVVPSSDIHMCPNKEYYNATDSIKLNGITPQIPLSKVDYPYIKTILPPNYNITSDKDYYVNLSTSYLPLDSEYYSTYKYTLDKVYTIDTENKTKINKSLALFLLSSSIIDVYYKDTSDGTYYPLSGYKLLNEYSDVNNIFYIDTYTEYKTIDIDYGSSTVYYGAINEYVNIKTVLKYEKDTNNVKTDDITISTFISKYGSLPGNGNVYTNGNDDNFIIKDEHYFANDLSSYTFDWDKSVFYTYSVYDYDLVGGYDSIAKLEEAYPHNIEHKYIRTKWFYNSYIVNSGLEYDKNNINVETTSYYTNVAIYNPKRGVISVPLLLNQENIILKRYEYNGEINTPINITDTEYKVSTKNTLSSLTPKQCSSYWIDRPLLDDNNNTKIITSYFTELANLGSIGDWYEKIMQYKTNLKTSPVDVKSLSYTYYNSNIYYCSTYIGTLEYNYKNGAIYNPEQFSSDSYNTIENYITQINSTLLGIIRNKDKDNNFIDLTHNSATNEDINDVSSLTRIKLLANGEFYDKNITNAISQLYNENSVKPSIIPYVVELKGVVSTKENIEDTSSNDEDYQHSETITYSITKPQPFTISNDVELEFTGTYTWHEPETNVKVLYDKSSNTYSVSNPIPKSEGYWSKDYVKNVIPLQVCSYNYYTNSDNGITANIKLPESSVIIAEKEYPEISYKSIVNDIIESTVYIYIDGNNEYIYDSTLPIIYDKDTNTYTGIKYNTVNTSLQRNVIPVYYKDEYMCYYFDNNSLTYLLAQYNNEYNNIYWKDETTYHKIPNNDKSNCIPKIDKTVSLIKRTSINSVSTVGYVTLREQQTVADLFTYATPFYICNASEVYAYDTIKCAGTKISTVQWNDELGQYETVAVDNSYAYTYTYWATKTIPFKVSAYLSPLNSDTEFVFTYSDKISSYLYESYNYITNELSITNSELSKLNSYTYDNGNNISYNISNLTSYSYNILSYLSYSIENAIVDSAKYVDDALNKLSNNLSNTLNDYKDTLISELSVNTKSITDTTNNLTGVLYDKLYTLNNSNNNISESISNAISDGINTFDKSFNDYFDSVSGILSDLHISNRLPTFKEFICDVSTKLYVAVNFENSEKSPHTIAKSSIIRANALWQELKTSNIVE